MKIKEYKLYKTAKKTSKENNLEYVDSIETGKRNILFDFSLLDNADELTNDENSILEIMHYGMYMQVIVNSSTEKSLMILHIVMVERYIIHIKFMMNMVVNADM